MGGSHFFGHSRRFWTPGESYNIGPGHYDVKLSADNAHMQKSFGCSWRAYDKVNFEGVHLENRGRASPGPGRYRQDFGKDCISHPMGFSKKLPRVKLSDTPDTLGPGSYSPENCISLGGSQVSSFRNPSAPSFGKGRKKRWRFDFKKLEKCIGGTGTVF